MAVVAALFLMLPPAEKTDAPRLICCGWDEVFVIDPTKPTKKLWTWRAADSPRIPKASHKWFRSTDDCKPIGDAILITSSSGGVALIRRRDQRCLFLAYSRNAHSACLLPNQRIAVASSFGGDELQIFDARRFEANAKPIAKIRLVGAHGTVWDRKRKRLWALGNKELLLVRIEKNARIVVERKWQLPTVGGHDLSPTRDADSLFVTTNTKVYRFACGTGKFVPAKAIADLKKVKSVDRHPRTGRIVFHQAGGKNWWSDTIRFAGEKTTIRLPGEKLYKVRWDVSEQSESRERQ